MSKDYKSYVKSKKPKSSKKKWAIFALIFIVLIAVLISFLVFLSQHKSTPALTKEVKKPAVTKKVEPPKITFEFYNLLPKQGSGTPQSRENEPQKSLPAVPMLPKNYIVQIASVRNAQDADTLKAKLLLNGYNPIVQKNMLNGQLWYRVQLGPFDKAEAAQWQKKLMTAGIDGLVKKIA